MTDFMQALDEMRGRTKYDYLEWMAPEVEAWIVEKLPFTAEGLSIGIMDKFDAYELVYGRLILGDEYKYFGLGYRGRLSLAQWQYKDMVRRAGGETLETASEALGIARSTIINAIFSNDWKSLDELIRYHFLGKAVMMAVDSLAEGGKKNDGCGENQHGG